MPKKIQLENYTGHVISDLLTNTAYPSRNRTARVDYQTKEVANTAEGSSILWYTYSHVSGLPEPREDLVCIVSSVTMNAVNQLCGNDGVMYPKCCIVNKPQSVDGRRTTKGCLGFKFNG